MDTRESRPLVLQARGGDAAALHELMARHLPGLRAYIRLRCGPALRARESASDLAQSACRDVLGDLGAFQWNGEAGFRAWLYTAALRKIADRAQYWNAQKRDVRREVPLDALKAGAASGVAGPRGEAPLAEVYRSVATPSQQAAGRETLERLELAFDTLSEEQREIIVLARIAGLSHAEIGERLGCTAGNARLRLFRALGVLSEALEAGAGS